MAKASARWRTRVLALILLLLVAVIVHQPLTRLYFEHMEVRMFAVAEAEGWDAEAIISYAENHPLRWLTAKAGGRRYSLEDVLVMSAYLDAILDDEPKEECAEALNQWLSRKGADSVLVRLESSNPEVIGNALRMIRLEGISSVNIAKAVGGFMDDARIGDESTQTLLCHQAAYALGEMGEHGLSILCDSMTSTNVVRRASAALGLMTICKSAWERTGGPARIRSELGSAYLDELTDCLRLGVHDENSRVSDRCLRGLAILGFHSEEGDVPTLASPFIQIDLSPTEAGDGLAP